MVDLRLVRPCSSKMETLKVSIKRLEKIDTWVFEQLLSSWVRKMFDKFYIKVAKRFGLCQFSHWSRRKLKSWKTTRDSSTFRVSDILCKIIFVYIWYDTFVFRRDISTRCLGGEMVELLPRFWGEPKKKDLICGQMIWLSRYYLLKRLWRGTGGLSIIYPTQLIFSHLTGFYSQKASQLCDERDLGP